MRHAGPSSAGVIGSGHDGLADMRVLLSGPRIPGAGCLATRRCPIVVMRGPGGKAVSALTKALRKSANGRSPSAPGYANCRLI